MNKPSLSVILLSLLINIVAIAQDELYFSKLNKSTGLSYSTVRDICEDSKGNIWLSTEVGLNKYDGYNISNYFANENNELKDSEFTMLAKYGEGIIIGSSTGLFIYNPDTEEISPLKYQNNHIGYVTDICESNDIVFASSKTGLFLYQNGEVTKINDREAIMSLSSDKSGSIWAATEHELIRLTTDGKELFNTSLTDEYISIVYVDDHGSLWVGSKTSGLFQFDPSDRSIKQIDIKGCRNDEMVYIRAITSDLKGNLWIGTENGLFIYNISSHNCINYKKNYLTPAKGVSSNPVYALYKSKDDVMWVGTFFDGVDYTDISSKRVRFIIPDDGNTSIKGHAIRSFMEDKNGNLWYATEDGGISIYNKSQHYYTHLNKDSRPALKGNNVHTIVQDSEGNFWAANYLDGIHKISHDLKTVKNYTAPKSDPRIMVEISSDSLLIAYVDGLYSMSIHDGGFQEFKPKFFKNKYINYLIYDNNGNLWISAGNEKLYKYQLNKNHQIVSYDFPYKVSSGTITENGDLWFSTLDSKIICFHNGEISEKTLNLGNKENAIRSIVSDGLGYLWMGTLNGIASYSISNGELHRYIISDGLISNEFSGTGAIRTKNNEIYLASIMGACSFMAEMMNERSASEDIPELVLSNFKNLNSNNVLLSGSIDILENVKLKHKYNSISFDITPVLIKSGIKPVYTIEYILDGVDKDYTKIDAKAFTAVYKNIPSGDHRFNIRLISPSGTIKAERNINITIKAPFLLSTTMMSTYLLFIVLAVLGIITRVHKSNKIKLDSQLSDQRARMFTYLAHEIKNPLAVVSAVLEDNKREITTDERNIINRNISRMQFLIKQLMDYRALEAGKIDINRTKGDLIDFIRTCYDTFFPLLIHNDQHGIFINNPDTLECSFDNDIIEKIYCNLLSNAVKHSDRGGEIRSEINITDDNRVSISVFNTGSYIPEEQISQITQPFFKAKGKDNSGIGMALVKYFTMMLNGTLTISSDLGVGTRFTVTLPIVHEVDKVEESSREYNLSNDILSNTYYELSSQFSSSMDNTIKEGRYTIVIADDNVDFNNLISSRLRDQYNILQAFDGKEAMALIDNTIDLVISDINMPESDGYTICARIKKNRSLAHIPVILLTSDHTESRRLESLNCGADGYMEKPVSIQELRIKVKNLIESKEKLKIYYQEKVKFDTIEKLSNKEEQFISDLTNYIRSNIEDPNLNVGTLADFAKMSRTQIYNRLKSSVNMSVAEFINKVKMDVAVESLSQTDKSVSEISWELGFSSPSYFVKTFKKQFGTTPKEFRNVNGHELQNDQ